MKYISVAVDGPAGSGKSTITKKIAEQLKFNYVDTGALYRALTLNFLRNGLKELDDARIKEILAKTEFKIEYNNLKQFVYINEEDVTEKIRTAEVAKYTSLFAKNFLVRDFLIDKQRDLSKGANIIMDGRDIGSVVLPNADLKIYLTASVEERAKRRYQEFLKNGVTNISLEKVEKEIKLRDYQDENREIAPLIMVEDAIKIDTTELTIEVVIEKIIKLIKNVM